MKHISLNERMLTAQNHKQEEEIKTLREQLEQYKESLRTMKDNLTEVKDLNKVLVNQISILSSKQSQWVKFIPCTNIEI